MGGGGGETRLQEMKSGSSGGICDLRREFNFLVVSGDTLRASDQVSGI